MDSSTNPLQNKPIVRECVHEEHLVTREQREALVRVIGARSRVAKDPEVMRFLAFLVAHARCDFGTTLAYVPRENINRARGESETASKTGEWLISFTRRLPVSVAFVGHRREEACRRVDVAALAEVRRAKRKGPRVEVFSGRPESDFEIIVDDAPKPTWLKSRAWGIASYFKSVPLDVYDPEVKGETERRAVDARAGEFPWRDCIGRRMVLGAREDANTCRLTDPWLSNMPRELVRILFPGWVEMDLQGAYVACFEAVCRAHGVETPILSALLSAPPVEPDPADGLLADAVAEARSDLWLGVCRELGVGPEVRKAVKDFVLPTLFGEGTEAREGRAVPLAEALGVLPAEVVAAPLVVEVVAATKALQKHVRDHGHLLGAGGRRIARKGRNELTMVHLACSDLEMELVAPIFAEAEAGRWAQRGVYIARYMSDGVDVTGPAEAVGDFYQAASAAVASKAEELGLRTRLGCKTPSTRIDVAAAQQALREQLIAEVLAA